MRDDKGATVVEIAFAAFLVVIVFILLLHFAH